MKKIIAISLTVFLATGCANYIDLTPQNELTVEGFYKTEQHAFAAIMAAYSNIQHLRYYGNNLIQISELSSDDITTKFATSQIDEFNWSAAQGAGGESNFRELWQFIYEGIYRTNLVLEKVSKNRRDKKPEIPFKSEADRNAILGEAYFLRGLHYFNAASFFGGAPIINETIEDVKFPGPLYTKRSTRLEVFEQSVEDLKTAIPLLPEAWNETNKGRITSLAAKALLGKIFLHKACYFPASRATDFDNAKSNLLSVITSGKFSLLTGPNAWSTILSPTSEYNAESVFEISYSRFGNFGWAHDLGIASENQQRDLLFGVQGGSSQGYGELIATKDWVLQAELGDPRIRQSLRFVYDNDFTGAGADDKTIKVSGQTYTPAFARDVKESRPNLIGEYFHVKKGVDNFGASGPGGAFGENNYRMIRYSDVLLMYAEACLESGDFPNAITYLNLVRDRARTLAVNFMSTKIIENSKRINNNVITFGGIERPDRDPEDEATKFAGYPNTSELLLKDNEVKFYQGNGFKLLSNYPYATETENGEMFNYYGNVVDEESFTFFAPGEDCPACVKFKNDEKLSLRDAIVRERRVELAFENHRFLDLRRWQALDELNHPGAANIVFKNKSNVEDRKNYLKDIHKLCPIPQTEIDLSRETLIQNPGY